MPKAASYPPQIFMVEHQPDAFISQANPVSAQWYPVLVATANVRIRSIIATITFVAGAPNPLEARIIIDGQTITYVAAFPGTGNPYEAKPNKQDPDTGQGLYGTVNDVQSPGGFLLEGRSVAVDVRVTWAVNQPSPLVCRVKWARW
jgi:hypothetical protein